MKKIFKASLVVLLFGCAFSCADHLEINPQGSLSQDVIVYNQDWLDKQLVASYGSLDGYIDNNSTNNAWRSPGSNWTFGDVPTDDVYKGSDAGDQAELNEIEWLTYGPSNAYFRNKWNAIFEGVNRTNQTLRGVNIAREEGIVDTDELDRIEGEARFLRAIYHMDALKNFRYVPYITEDMTESQANQDPDASYAAVDADLQYAIDNLPPTQGDAGRATSWSAKAFLAKSKMFQENHTAAAPILDDIINNGPYDLVENYHHNFNAAFDNNVESVFAIQNSVNDGAPESANGNWGNILAFTNGGPVACCGFYQPSQNLVNAFKTQSGLPMINTFNNVDVANDQGIASEEPFTPDTAIPLDPRL